MSDNIRGTHSDLVAFLFLSVWPSHLGLPLLLLVILLSKTTHRHPTFINMCITWIISGFASCILLYAGKTTGPEPPKMLCLIQASILRGVPPMAAMATLLLVFQMFSVIRSSSKRENAPVDGPLRLLAMIAAPYILFLSFSIATAFVGANEPNNISRDRRFFYCSVHSHVITITLSLVSAIILLATFAFEIWIVVVLYKTHISLKRQSPLVSSPLELGLPIRIVIFGAYVVIGTCLSFFNVGPSTSPVPDLILSTVPSAVVLLFGSQPDILRVLCFWHRPKSPPVRDQKLSSPPKRPLRAP
jgi:hypothetical protein